MIVLFVWFRIMSSLNLLVDDFVVPFCKYWTIWMMNGLTTVNSERIGYVRIFFNLSVIISMLVNHLNASIRQGLERKVWSEFYLHFGLLYGFSEHFWWMVFIACWYSTTFYNIYLCDFEHIRTHNICPVAWIIVGGISSQNKYFWRRALYFKLVDKKKHILKLVGVNKF